MTMPDDILTLVKTITTPGAVVAVAYFVFSSPLAQAFSAWIRARIPERAANAQGDDPVTLSAISDQVALLGSNHLHEVKEALDRIERTLSTGFESTNRRLDAVVSDIAFLKGRINGKH